MSFDFIEHVQKAIISIIGLTGRVFERWKKVEHHATFPKRKIDLVLRREVH